MTPEEREHHGWEAAVTLVTPIKSGWWPRRKRRFIMSALNRQWEVDLSNRIPGFGLRETVGDKFKVFNHLHYARWSLVDKLPRPTRQQPRESGPYTLLLFTAHFDFGWRRYLGTFIETISSGLWALWGDAPSWVWPKDGFARFERFVDDQRVEHLHLFAAYPSWSANDVRAALRRHHEQRSFEIGEEVLAGALALWRGGARRRDAVERRLQYCSGQIPELDSAYARIGAARRPELPHPHRGLTYLLPVRIEEEGAVGDAIRALPPGPASPFARVPGTHFARMTIIGREYFRHQQARVDPLRSAYLLLSAEIDGDAGPWLRTLLADPAVAGIVQACQGGGATDLAAFVQQCRIPRTLEFVDYQRTTVADIFAAAGVPGPGSGP